MRSGFALDSIVPQRDSPVPLHLQLYRGLRRLIETRGLAHGTALPSTRALATDLGLGRNTVISAYDQLSLEGFIETRAGAPPLVRELPVVTSGRRRHPEGEDQGLSARGRLMGLQPFHYGQPGVTAFHPGLPDIGEFPFNTWARLLTRRARHARADLVGSYNITGYPGLREAIARYLTASRGVSCAAEQVVVTNGAQSAFDLLARVLLDPGDTLWMEEPGYYGAASAFVAAGARLAPLRVGEAGWKIIAPEGPVPRAIFVTPSCQHPLGLTMSMGQRLDLIRMAEAWDAWIIEDDYDSEYRFQGQPIPALQGVATGDRTVFVGTFAKILFPAMRLGYMVVPTRILGAVTAALSATGQFAPLLTQAALADFMNEGHLTRHLRRTRRLYAQRRESFYALFDQHMTPWMQLHRTGTGIQQVARFHHPTDDRAVARAARAAGVNVSPLSIQCRHAPEAGLVLGFAAADEKAQDRGFRRLAEVLTAMA